MAQSKRKPLSVVSNPKPQPAIPDGPGAAEATSGGMNGGPGSGVGQLLRQARQRAALSLPQVAGALRIREAYIEAIEDGRFRDLPGSAYATGFIRSYADLLRLDGEEIVRRFKLEMASLPQSPDLVFPAPVPEGRVPGGAILLIAVVLAVSAYGGWYYLSATDRSIADLVPPLPQRFAALLHRQHAAEQPGAADTGDDEPSAAPGTAADSADTAESGDAADDVAEPPTELVPAGPSGIAAAPTLFAATPTVTGAPPFLTAPPAATGAPNRPAAGTAGPAVVMTTGPAAVGPSSAAAAVIAPAAPAGAGTAGAATPAQTAARTPPAPPPAVPPEQTGRRFGATTGPSRILIRATGDSWVQVRDGQGRLVMTRVLRPGDSYAVPDTPGLRLDTGNAGGLAIEVDGTAIPSIGSKGEVIRNIALDAGRLTAAH